MRWFNTVNWPQPWKTSKTFSPVCICFNLCPVLQTKDIGPHLLNLSRSRNAGFKLLCVAFIILNVCPPSSPRDRGLDPAANRAGRPVARSQEADGAGVFSGRPHVRAIPHGQQEHQRHEPDLHLLRGRE